MKKVLLTAMALLTIASASVFGMYGNGDSWIDFLVHGNQLRARMDQLGFVLGNDTIKGTFGFRANTGSMGSILKAATGNSVSDNNSTALDATISAGIGYTSDVFGIGVGYNYTWISKNLGVHTPVLMINALNDNLRIAIPIQIAVSDNLDKTVSGISDRKDYLGVSTDIQLRYYTGIDAFNAIRFYVNYGQNSYKIGTEEYSASTLGFQLRLYFLNTTVGNVNINPYLRLEYRTALDSVGRAGYSTTEVAYNAISSSSMAGYRKVNAGGADQNPFTVKVMPVLGIGANSDVVSLWVEPSIGYSVTGGAYKDSGLTHALAWGAYTELYITPVKDLEWYFEMDVNGNVAKDNYGANNPASPVYFETSTGITWYLPSFGAAE